MSVAAASQSRPRLCTRRPARDTQDEVKGSCYSGRDTLHGYDPTPSCLSNPQWQVPAVSSPRPCHWPKLNPLEPFHQKLLQPTEYVSFEKVMLFL